MILQEFSKYLQLHDEDILNNHSTMKLLSSWIINILEREPVTNVEKIIHTEITYAKNLTNDFLLIGKSESGRVLISALYNFALSYEQTLLARWLEDKKASDFNS